MILIVDTVILIIFCISLTRFNNKIVVVQLMNISIEYSITVSRVQTTIQLFLTNVQQKKPSNSRKTNVFLSSVRSRVHPRDQWTINLSRWTGVHMRDSRSQHQQCCCFVMRQYIQEMGKVCTHVSQVTEHRFQETSESKSVSSRKPNSIHLSI